MFNHLIIPEDQRVPISPELRRLVSQVTRDLEPVLMHFFYDVFKSSKGRQRIVGTMLFFSPDGETLGVEIVVPELASREQEFQMIVLTRAQFMLSGFKPAKLAEKSHRVVAQA